MGRQVLYSVLHAAMLAPAAMEASAAASERGARSGSVSVAGVQAEDGWSAPQGAFEYRAREGERELNLALAIESMLGEDTGRGFIRTRAPDGQLEDERVSRSRRVVDRMELSGGWQLPVWGGALEATAHMSAERMDERFRTGALGATVMDERIDEREDVDDAGVDLGWTRELADGATVAVHARHLRGRLRADSRFLDDPGSRFDWDADRHGTEAGVDWTRASEHWRWTIGAQGTTSRFDSRFMLSDAGEWLDLPGSHVAMRERNTGIHAQAERGLAGGWRLTGRLAAQSSQLRLAGDTPRHHDVTYLKPSLALDSDPGAAQRWHVSLGREVDERDPHDFVASAALDIGAVSVGNADLRQSRNWRFTAGWERDIGEGGSVALRWQHDVITDAIDRVIVVLPDGELFDATGNIGHGRRDTLDLAVTAPLAGWGLPDSRLEAALTWRNSRVTDPLNGLQRNISLELPLEGGVELHNELPAHGISWGLGIDVAMRETEYAFDEITVLRAPWSWRVFVEKALTEDWSLQAQLSDLGGRRFVEDRYQYDGPRSEVPQRAWERRGHRSPGYVLLTLTRSFGG